MLHRKAPGGAGGQSNDIKAHRLIRRMGLQPKLRCFDHFLPLGKGHALLRQGNHAAAAGFDLAKYQAVLILGNQIQLSEPALKIALQYFPSFFLQIAQRSALSL